jgi:hypothetical protein
VECLLSNVNAVYKFVGAPTFSTTDPFHPALDTADLLFTSPNSPIADHVRCRPADMPGVTNLPRWAYN